MAATSVMKQRKQVLTREDDELVIKGVFKTIRVHKNDLVNFAVKRDYCCKVFDWSKVIITTKEGNSSLYTKELKLPLDAALFV